MFTDTSTDQIMCKIKMITTIKFKRISQENSNPFYNSVPIENKDMKSIMVI